MNGKLIVITGFSGAGKDSVLRELQKRNPQIKNIVTHTSRGPRSGEIAGVDHHFVSKTEFEKMIYKERLFEFVHYAGIYKGTHKNELSNALRSNLTSWRIDMLRTANLEQTFFEKFESSYAQRLTKNTLKVLIKAESEQVLLERFSNRAGSGEDLKIFEKRLNRDVEVFNKNKNSFGKIVINKTGTLDKTVDQIEEMINSFIKTKF
jgi:guanylate kinase